MRWHAMLEKIKKKKNTFAVDRILHFALHLFEMRVFTMENLNTILCVCFILLSFLFCINNDFEKEHTFFGARSEYDILNDKELEV